MVHNLPKIFPSSTYKAIEDLSLDSSKYSPFTLPVAIHKIF